MKLKERLAREAGKVRRLADRAQKLSRRAEAFGRDAVADLKPSRRALRQLQADHELRHRPSGFSFALAEGIDQLRGDHWDALGRTALKPSRRAWRQLTCYVRHRVPAFNALVQGLLRVAPEPEAPPARTPFKAR